MSASPPPQSGPDPSQPPAGAGAWGQGGAGWGGGPPGPPPRRTNGLAVAGFVVALVGVLLVLLPFFGAFVALVGLALAVPGLGRARQVGTGRGLAISGIVLGAIGLVGGGVWSALVAAGVVEYTSGSSITSTRDDDEDEDDVEVNPSRTPLPTLTSLPTFDPIVDDVDLELGECFNVSGTSVDAIPCDEPHDREVFAVVIHPDEDAFPGADALGAFAEEQCALEVPDFVQEDGLPEDIGLGYFVPLTGAWDAGERDIICFFSTEAGPITGTLEEAAGT